MRNTYIIVFGLIGMIIVAAAVSTLFFNAKVSGLPLQNGTANYSTLSNLRNYGPAPNLQGISGWINTGPINISQLRGKVVVVDFWTYSCINCIRSIPHLNAWYNEYGGSNGLVIIGVSTPEFQFEHNYSNVYNAVQRFGIRYPVALDNNYSTWDAYGNEYWPADYIIDKNGDIRYVTYGEGNYNTTEQVIRELLLNAGYGVPNYTTNVPLGANFSGIGTPEIYLGWETARAPIGNKQGFVNNSTVNYTLPAQMQNNTVYLSGKWYDAPDSIIAVNNSKIFLTYKAEKLNVVAGTYGANSSTVTVYLDRAGLNNTDAGSDIRLINGTGTANIRSYRLYNLVSAQSYGWRTIEIDASPGFRIYTFTFG